MPDKEVKPRFSYDARCEELAEYFLIEKPRNDEHVQKLAQTIQDAIEGWLRERDEASSQPQQGVPVQPQMNAGELDGQCLIDMTNVAVGFVRGLS